jgi:predicted DNA-binding WGR domain protein
MNRLLLIDSKLSLDAESRNHDHHGMITQRYQLYIEKTDKAKNMARFYALSIEPNLFGEASLTRRWGRLGTKGKIMVHNFEVERDAVTLFLDLVRQKRSRGYSTVLQTPRTSR